MMRKLLPFVATALVAAVFVGSTSLVGTAGPGEETFTVVSTLLRFKEIDVGRSGPSPGDFFIEKDTLWNEGETQRVGADWIKCTFDFANTSICTVAVKINGRGQLTGTGAVKATGPTPSFAFPVTGGTGDFRHVTGEVQVTFEADDRATLEFHLAGTTG